MSKVLLSILLLAATLPCTAGPAIPEALAPWVPWVLHPQDRRACPVGQGEGAEGTEPAGDSRVCAWPGRLSLTLDAQGGRFSQAWDVYAETWVPLPGDGDNWPQEVRDGERPQPAVLHGGLPAVKLAAGRHVLNGRFEWSRLPDGLTVPAETGLLSLVLDGAAVAAPRIDRGGRLWLARGGEAAEGEEEGDRLALTVYRRIDDDLPLRATARLELDVSGRARQVHLGPALLPGGLPLRVQSPLPSRLDPDGSLTLQVRPGNWVVELEEQHPGAVISLARAQRTDPWPEQEIWSFAARPDLRQVDPGGPPAVDPRQTGAPSDWQGLPTYRLAPGETLRLTELRRGNPDPGPDRLTLERDLWLDLSGGGYSVRDRIAGQIVRGWRLEATPPLELGQVRVDGEPRLIARLADSAPPGVEVRRGRLNLSADSRMEAQTLGLARPIPVSGWDVPFDAIGTRLHLPPGWDLLAVSGTDNLPDTWLARWTLLDLFLVLILALGVGRLWGWPWGLLALATLALTWRAPGAPHLLWLQPLIAAALLRLLPERAARPRRVRPRTLARWYYRLSLVLLLLAALPFLAGQVRNGLYPHLERPGVGLGGSLAGVGSAGAAQGAAAPMPDVAFRSMAEARAPLDAERFDDGSNPPPPPPAPLAAPALGAAPPRVAAAPPSLDEPDPGARVQSGAGVPDWGWRRIDLNWNGSVDSGEMARLWLLSPFWHMLWSLLGALLTVLLGLRMAGLLGGPVEPPSDPGVSLPTPLDLPPLRASGFEPLPGLEPLPEGPQPRPVPQPEPDPGIDTDPGSRSRLALSLALALGAGLVLIGSAPLGCRMALAGELPSPELLGELQARLAEPPDCLPDCVDLGSLTLEARPDRLRLVLTLDAATPTAAPVPGGAGGWLPAELSLDGAPLDGLRRDASDRLLVPLTAGRHRLELAGPLPDRSQVEIPFPLRPRQVRAQVQGWTLEGLDAAGHPGAQVRLVRVAGPGAQNAAPLTQGALPPLLQVERTLRLGIDWRVATRVRRLSPAEFPVSLAVPLLPGESVQTPGFAVRDGTLLVNLAPGETETGWASTLEQSERLRLSAGTDPRIGESWSVDLSPRWHLDWSGVAPVHQVAETDRWLPTWRPLAGEILELKPSRPAGVPGLTLTLDRVDFVSTPSRRGRDGALDLVLRSTQGGTHTLRLPQGAVPTLLKLDGRELPLPGGGADATRGLPLDIPLTPGSAAVSLRWREPAGIAPWLVPASPDLGSPAVNLNLAVEMPQDRWVLYVRGPRIGPVVLFWGVLLVLAGLAAALGRVRLAPLNTWDWLLLGIGLSLAQVWVLVLVGGWLLALGLRRRLSGLVPRWRYNLAQVGLALLTLAALAALVGAVSQGLLGAPDMQIVGNGSEGSSLRWYQDRGGPLLPQVQVLSVPMWVYRGLMLGWALWLAYRLLDWLRWGWEGYCRPVLWREADAEGLRGLRRSEPRPEDRSAEDGGRGGAPGER